LYGYETWSLTATDEHKLQVDETEAPKDVTQNPKIKYRNRDKEPVNALHTGY